MRGAQAKRVSPVDVSMAYPPPRLPSMYKHVHSHLDPRAERRRGNMLALWLTGMCMTILAAPVLVATGRGVLRDHDHLDTQHVLQQLPPIQRLRGIYPAPPLPSPPRPQLVPFSWDLDRHYSAQALDCDLRQDLFFLKDLAETMPALPAGGVATFFRSQDLDGSFIQARYLVPCFNTR